MGCDPTISPLTPPSAGTTPASGVTGCCYEDMSYEGLFAENSKIQQLTSTQTAFNGKTAGAWKARIDIKCLGTAVTATVTIRFKLTNRTGDTATYPGTTAISDEAAQKKFMSELECAKAVWNKRSYRLRTTDDKCGVTDIRVIINLEAGYSISSSHYSVDLVNAPSSTKEIMGPVENTIYRSHVGRSYVSQPNFYCKLNLQNKAFTHEFAHMIGLVDEYHEFVKDPKTGKVRTDRGGVQYKLLDGTTVHGFPANARLVFEPLRAIC